MSTLRFGGLGLVVLTFGLVAAATVSRAEAQNAEPTTEWIPFESREEGFRVLFPGKPEVVKRQTKSGPSLRAAIEDAARGLGFFVDATRTDGRLPKDPQGLIDALRKSNLPAGASQRSFQTIEVPGAVAFRQEVERADGVVIGVRFTATAGHLYMVGVAGKRAAFERHSDDVERFLSSFALLKTASQPPGGTTAGSPFTSEAGRFRVEFPAAPREETRNSPARRHHIFHAGVDGVEYVVAYADFTADELRAAGSPEKLLKTVRDRIAGDSPVRAEKPRTIGDSLGLELVYDPKPDQRAIFHIYLVGLRSYEVGVLGTTDEMRKQQATLERFYESFQVRSPVRSQPTKLGVAAAEPRYGRLGPRRPDWNYLPFDVLCARLEAVGMNVDDEGRVDIAGTMQFFAPDGSSLSDKSFQTRDKPTDGRLPVNVMQDIPQQPGDYRLQVTLHDRRSDARVVWRQTVVVRPVTMAIVAPEFFRDPDAKVSAPASGRVGEKLYLEFRVIGFDRSQDRIDTAMTLQIIDEQGKPMLAEPVRSTAKTDDAEMARRNQVVTYFTRIPLPRPGRVTVRAVVSDLVGGDVAKLELPLEISGSE